MKRKLKIFKISCALFLICYVSYTFITQQAEYNKYEKLKVYYTEQIRTAKIKTEEYQEYTKYVKSDKYIENIARQKLGMILPEEKIYIDISG